MDKNSINTDLLNEEFHDSHILDIDKKDDMLNIVISFDSFWSPGKPFGLLTLVNPINHEQIIDTWNDKIDATHIEYLTINKKKSENAAPYEVSLKFGNYEDIFNIRCKNFWLDRIEKYKDHKPY